MNKKQIIQILRSKGFKANYKNVIFSLAEKGYVLFVTRKEFIRVEL